MGGTVVHIAAPRNEACGKRGFRFPHGELSGVEPERLISKFSRLCLRFEKGILTSLSLKLDLS